MTLNTTPSLSVYGAGKVTRSEFQAYLEEQWVTVSLIFCCLDYSSFINPIFEGSMIVCGGQTTDSNDLNKTFDCHAYDPLHDKWQAEVTI